MDVNMPGLDGISATRHIAAAAPEVKVLVMTMHEDDTAVFAAIRAGARGYVLKGAAQDETLRAIRAVAEGEAIFGAAIATRAPRYSSCIRRGQKPTLRAPSLSCPPARSRSSAC